MISLPLSFFFSVMFFLYVFCIVVIVFLVSLNVPGDVDQCVHACAGLYGRIASAGISDCEVKLSISGEV